MELPFEVPELRKGKLVNKKETNKKATKLKEYYNTINLMNLLNLFEFAKTKVKIKNYDENFNVGLGTPNIRAL